ncbi:hypothetical protein [Thermophilibacter immobilis]|jgi:hypothetical protein|uniref:hypothetical protein n=1 Tax=Thermophilibacter immobilis TaxID=2779519 RepID=UPI001E401121|nr:hypothetical protein [Thermophilibacter immobilis]
MAANAKKNAGEKDLAKDAASDKDASSATAVTKKTTAAGRQGLGTPAWVAISVAALVVGVLCGHFLLGNAGTVSLGGKTTLSADELDSTIATYTYQGATSNISARDVITQSSTVDAAANSDGTYAVPSPSDVVVYAQDAIILQGAKDKGLSVTDDEVSAYATQMFGTDDYATIASSYSIDEDTAKTTLTSSALMSKLRDAVVTTTLPDQPTAPTAPADGAEDTPTADYASYVISLAGDEWDAGSNTWASTDGDYYAALSSYEITNDSATYAAAQAAYSVAYTAYSTAYTQRATEWSTYVNSLLSQATMQIGSLV